MDKKQRNTRQRKIVYEAVLNRSDHPTVDMLYEDISKIDKTISKGTVYRNLNILTENNEIYHVRTPGSDRFDRRTDPHCHIICLKCGCVTDAYTPYSEEEDRKVAEESGFVILGHSVLYEGICPSCNNETH